MNFPPAADLKREALAGLTTFFTMAYIIVVNPAILSAPGTGMPFSGVLTATVLLSFLMTALMGAYALCGRRRAVSAGTWATAALSAGLLILDHARW